MTIIKKNIVTRDTCICFGRCKLGWSCDYIQMEEKKNMLLKEIDKLKSEMKSLKDQNT